METNKIRLSDAHTHFINEEDLNLRIQNQIVSLFSNANPQEMDKLLAKNLSDNIILTCGIHPWSADVIKFEEMEKYLQSVSVVGEIGMDSVWCDVDLKIQEAVFRRQLDYAAKNHKAVILHTKGQEKEIAKIIKEYPNKYLIHWYSCDEHLEDYIEMDCYFSIGPDVFWNEATKNVAKSVPLGRILSETDGLNAVKWAYEEAPFKKQSPKTSEEALNNVVSEIAKLRGLTKEECYKICYENLVHGFLNK